MFAALKLWQLLSPNLPIGAYAYSGGLEYAVESGQVASMEGAEQWLSDQLKLSLARMDLPYLRLMHEAWQSGNSIEALNESLMAMRDTQELRAEDRHLGNALARVLVGLDVAEAEHWCSPKPTTFAAMWTLAAKQWGIETQDMLLGYAWGWAENQVAAAIKLIPLGQTQGQQLLWALHPAMEAAVTASQTIEKDHIGALNFGVAIASAQHETQHTRLYRS